jgi:hypothetical protein
MKPTKIELQKNRMFELANTYGFSSNVLQLLMLLVDENKHFRQKSINQMTIEFNRLITYTEQEQVEFIENAIARGYRGLVWCKKDKPKDIIQSKVEQAYNLFK